VVIVGDLAEDPDYPCDERAFRLAQEAADLAAQRLRDRGYSVTLIGQAYPYRPATRGELEEACRRQPLRGLVGIFHGLNADAVRAVGQLYFMADGPVSGAEVREWRASREPLTAVALYACNTALDPDFQIDWNIDANAHVLVSRSRLNATIMRAVEKRVRCPEDRRSESKGWVDTGRTEGQGYVNLYMRTIEGESAEAAYGFQGGFVVEDTLVSGDWEYQNDAVGARVMVPGGAVAEEITIWANKYRSAPTDTVPSSIVCANAYAFGMDGGPGTAVVELIYDESYLASLGMSWERDIELWRFDEEQMCFLRNDEAVVDSVSDRVQFTLADSIGEWVLIGIPRQGSATVEAPVEASGGRSLIVRVLGNPGTDEMRISCVLPRSGDVQVRVMNPGGQEVARRRWSWLPEGKQELGWRIRSVGGAPLASGNYYVQVETPSGYRTAKWLVIR
jgi:hypothetical protein